MAACKGVELGFVEKCDDPWQLRSLFFPSKVGGKPAWLDLQNLPTTEELQCKICGKQLVFLVQVYATLPEVDSSCFHRTVLVFCCRDGKCYQSNSNSCFVVYRNQLPRENKFYCFDPPPEIDCYETNASDVETFCADFEIKNSMMKRTPLCLICGCRGDKSCAKCHINRYCCKDHQKVDWVNGHKTQCGKIDQEQLSPGMTEVSKRVLFPEFDLVTETEEIIQQQERSEEDRIKTFEKYMKDSEVMDKSVKKDKDLESLAVDGKEALLADKQFRIFRKRIAQEPEQVLRYDREGTPLWVSGEHVPLPSDIPNCECGAERIFEFQILPQLLNYLNVDHAKASVDWGTLVIYTCSKSCNQGAAYHQEFLWKQDFSDTGIPKDLFT